MDIRIDILLLTTLKASAESKLRTHMSVTKVKSRAWGTFYLFTYFIEYVYALNPQRDNLAGILT